jgi:hypothetical protein
MDINAICISTRNIESTSCSTNCRRYVQPVKSPGFSFTGFQYFSNSVSFSFLTGAFVSEVSSCLDVELDTFVVSFMAASP